VLFKPSLRLNEAVETTVALGKSNLATISWRTGARGEKHVELRLEKAVEVISQLPGGKEEEYGVVDRVTLKFCAEINFRSASSSILSFLDFPLIFT
jgi:hypothetical protein